MSERGKHGDDAELIERMERGEPASDTDRAARAPYERLIERIGALDVVEPPPGWVDRAVDRWERTTVAAPSGPTPRRWAAWAGLGAVLTAAALFVVMTQCRHRGAPDGFGVDVEHQTASRSSGAAVGDTLAIHAPHHGADVVELRVYRDHVLIERCPGATACVETARALALSFAIARPGIYQVVAITGATALPSPGGAGLEDDVREARQAGQQVELSQVFDAR